MTKLCKKRQSKDARFISFVIKDGLFEGLGG